MIVVSIKAPVSYTHLDVYKRQAHNTLRGAAGGAVLIAELLAAKGYITPKN